MRCLCMGETLLRYSTNKGERIQNLNFHVHVGGSETNIAVSLSKFGFDSYLFSKISDNDLGEAIIHFLNGYGVNTSRVLRSNKRVGSYFLEMGSGNRTSKVIYDRADSAMTPLKYEEVDIITLCHNIDVFIVSGITMALSKEILELVLAIMKYCKEHQIQVVYDSNYRAKLWSQEEAGIVLKKVLPYVDILSAGYLDAKYLLQIDSLKEEFEEKLLDSYQKIKEVYPNIQYIVSTKRDIISSSVNDLQGFLFDGAKLTTSNMYHIDDIIDRVGAGDAFISGVVYTLLKGKEPKYSINFGCSAAILKHTIHGDVNTVSVEEVEAYMNNGATRIQR